MSGLGVLLALATSTQCPSMPGVDVIFAKPEVRVIWAGELHGATEQPQAFGDLVCVASQALEPPPVVLLERPADEKPLWDAFMASDGGGEARSALLAAPMWRTKMPDGRSSQAMVALAERLRVLKQARKIAGVDMLAPSRPAPGRQAYEDQLADAVLASLAQAPRGTRALVLSGNVHARKSDVTTPDQTYAAAAKRLSPQTVFSILLVSGPGEAWNCQQDGCGPHPYAGRQLVPGLSPDAPEGYDAVLSAAAHTTASRPAVASSVDE